MSSLLEITLLQGGFIQQFIEWIITNGGLYFLLFVIFAETGLLVGFFLPGDSFPPSSGVDSDRYIIYGCPLGHAHRICLQPWADGLVVPPSYRNAHRDFNRLYGP